MFGNGYFGASYWGVYFGAAGEAPSILPGAALCATIELMPVLSAVVTLEVVLSGETDLRPVINGTVEFGRCQ